jgi:CheY-like chemotaxis protein
MTDNLHRSVSSGNGSSQAIRHEKVTPERGEQISARSYAGLIAIAPTTDAAEIAQQKALQAGLQTHITKSVTPEALVRSIVSLLRSDR